MNSRRAGNRDLGPMVQGDIAIIGMACLFPSAPDLETYWQNIISRVDAITELPPEAWEAGVSDRCDSTAGDQVDCRRGGFLGPLASFDPLQHGIMPSAVQGGEPDQWLVLRVARAALADAGYGDQIPERHRTAVILGKGGYLNLGNLSLVQHGKIIPQTLRILRTLHPEYSETDLELIRKELEQCLPPLGADTVSGLIPNITASRIANRLDLMGPSHTVDGACASSLIAASIAVRELLTHECDLALVGGAHVVTPDPLLMVFSQLGALSRRGQIRPFDKDADGTMLGEGIGILVLKRHEDAERDGDRIYAVIKGIGMSSDGRGLGVTAPRLEGEILALQRALEQADVSPRTVGLIEAHGTGTPVGDAAELEALAKVFGDRDGAFPWCALGSVKSMIGHLMPAAGSAGLIKAVLALHHKVLPPTLNVDEPNPKLRHEKTPFYLNTEPRPWIHGSTQAPRRAGVNAFGFGGINAHVVLEEYPVPDETVVPSHDRHWETEVIVLQGESRADLVRQGRQLRRFLQAGPDVALTDIAYTLNIQSPISNTSTLRQPFDGAQDTAGLSTSPQSPLRLAIVASTLQDLRQKLDRALERLADPTCRKIKTRDGVYYFEEPVAREGKMAFLFPGEGAQYINMLADLCIHFPEVRKCFDDVDRVYADHPRGYMPSDFIFPRPALTHDEREAAEHRMWQMDVAVEALLTANNALYTLLDRLQIRPDAVLGHSTGEYSAMRAAGMLGHKALFSQHVLELNRIHEEVAAAGGVPEATLVAVAASREQTETIAEAVGSQIYVAMDNCPHQVLLAASGQSADRALQHIRRQGLIYEVLSFDRAYHTPLFAPYAEALRDFLATWIVASPQIPLYSCTTAGPYPTDLAEVHQIAYQHWMRPVEFSKTIEAMYADGVRLFVEVGPRGNLSSFVDDILRGRPYLTVPTNVMRRSSITQLNHAIGLLAAQGIPMRLDPLYTRRAPRHLDLERPSDAMDEGKREVRPIKLATGWPSMGISEDSAARLRQRFHGAKAQKGKVATKQVDSGVQEHANVTGEEPVAVRVEERREVSALPSDASAPQHLSTPAQEDRQPPKNAILRQSRAPTMGSEVMSAYMQTMEHFLEMQQEIMEAYLTSSDRRVFTVARHQLEQVGSSVEEAVGTELAAPDTSPGLSVAPQPAPSTSESQAPLVTEVEPRVSTPQPPSDAVDMGQVLLRLVSDRTGYPTEMLDFDVNLEADLGIDSIKRVEILGAFQQETGIPLGDKMEQLAARRTLQEMVEFLTTPHGNNDEQPPTVATTADSDSNLQSLISHLPFVQEVLSLTPAETLEAQCEISLERYPFLLDHTLGRQVSLTDLTLTGLPVMPLTMSIEMLAEAAHVLAPDKVLVGMRDVRAHRWLALEDDRLTLKVVATREPSWSGHGQAIHVQVFDAEASPDERTGHATALVEGTAVFYEAYPDPPQASPLSLRNERPSHWIPERLYEEGLFHGPSFRGVASMDRWGEDGAEATLEVLPLEGLFASGVSDTPSPRQGQSLLSDPVLLDQPGQVVAFWMAEHLERGYVVFPFHLEALHLYNAPRPPSTGVGARSSGRVTCQARIALIGDWQVRSDLDVVQEDGFLWTRFVGWEDWRFDMPRSFLRLLLSPSDAALSEPWSTPATSLSASGAVQAHRLTLDAFPDGFFTAHGEIWRKVLVRQTLGHRERELWHNLRTPESRRLEWLLGRVVAKDAVRQHVKERYGLVLCPADVEILPDGNGRPVVTGRWTDQVPCVPLVSLSHSAGVAVAVVADCEAARGIGVDIEHTGRMNEQVQTLAFTDQERELLSSVPESQKDGWSLRFWCAKEAVAKALGQGMVGGPQALVVQALDMQSGLAQIGLAGELAHRVAEEDGVTLTAFTAREGDLVVATSLLYQPEIGR